MSLPHSEFPPRGRVRSSAALGTLAIVALAVACGGRQGASEQGTVDEKEDRRLALGECADFLSVGSQLRIWDEGAPGQIALFGGRIFMATSSLTLDVINEDGTGLATLGKLPRSAPQFIVDADGVFYFDPYDAHLYRISTGGGDRERIDIHPPQEPSMASPMIVGTEGGDVLWTASGRMARTSKATGSTISAEVPHSYAYARDGAWWWVLTTDLTTRTGTMFRQLASLPDASSAEKIADIGCPLFLTPDGAICTSEFPLVRIAHDGSQMGEIDIPAKLRGDYVRVLFADQKGAIIHQQNVAPGYPSNLFSVIARYDFAARTTRILSCSAHNHESAVADDHRIVWRGYGGSNPNPRSTLEMLTY